MRSLELPPSPPLRPFVQTYWSLELERGEGFPVPHRIAPDGVVELVFHYGEPIASRFDGEGFSTQPRSLLVTQTRRFVEILPAAGAGFLTVRFRPWGACHFLAMPVAELADRQVGAEEVWWREVAEVEDGMAAASDLSRRVAVVERFLLERLRRHRKADVEAVVRAVWRRGGDLRVRELCRELGLGERTLERLFASALGMPPRSFLRLNRFLAACDTLRRGGWASLTEVGYDCGYYDQSHFIADCRAFAGMTPGELVAASSFSYLAPGS